MVATLPGNLEKPGIFNNIISLIVEVDFTQKIYYINKFFCHHQKFFFL